MNSKRAFAKIELIVASPLTRALTTSDIILKGVVSDEVAKIAQPLAREWLFLSSDVGRTRAVLEKEFPRWNFDELPETDWWYTPSDLDPKPLEFDFRGNTQELYGYSGEPTDVFVERIIALRNWLQARTETTIAVVAHFGVLRALTGKNFENAEIYECDPNSLLDDQGIKRNADDIADY